jgi:hypothetical protein
MPRWLLVLGFDMLDKSDKPDAVLRLESELGAMPAWQHRRTARIWARQVLEPAIAREAQRLQTGDTDGVGLPIIAQLTVDRFGQDAALCAEELLERSDSSPAVAIVAAHLDPKAAVDLVLDLVATGEAPFCLIAHDTAHQTGAGSRADELLGARCARPTELAYIIESIARCIDPRKTAAERAAAFATDYTAFLSALGALVSSASTRTATLREAEAHGLLDRYFDEVAGGESLTHGDAVLRVFLDSGPPNLQFASAVLLLERGQHTEQCQAVIKAFETHPPELQRDIADYCANRPSPSDEYMRARHAALIKLPPTCAEVLFDAVYDRAIGKDAVAMEFHRLVENINACLGPENPREHRIRGAKLLLRLGRAAAQARPGLESMLESDDREVRSAAQAVLWNIRLREDPDR